MIANGLVGVLLAEAGPMAGGGVGVATAASLWDVLNGAGLLRARGLAGIAPNVWRILAIIRLALQALLLYGAGAGTAHHLRNLQLLQATPAMLGLVCLLAFLPRSRALIGACAFVWAATPAVLVLQVAGYRPILVMKRVAQVRDAALERLEFSDPESGLTVSLPSGWYLLPADNPFWPAGPGTDAVIACPRAELFGTIRREFMAGSKVPYDGQPVSRYLDGVVADRTRQFPATRVLTREPLPGLDAPAERVVMATTDAGGRSLIVFAAAFDDGYRFHLISASCPKAEQDEATREFGALEDRVDFTRTTEEREGDAVTRMTAGGSSPADDALRAFARYILRHRLSEEEAHALGMRLGATMYRPLSAAEAVELAPASGRSLVALPEHDLGPLKTQGAVMRVTDRETVAKAAVGSIDPRAREGAASLIADQGLLAKLAIEDPDPRVRLVAVRRLTDQSVLRRLAIGETNWGPRQAAIMKLKDQSVLARLATQDADWRVRCYATGGLTDQELLAKLATGDREWSVRAAAAAKLTDQAVLAGILNDEREAVVRRAAVRRVTDRALLAKLATGDADADVRYGAVGRLTDPALLARIAAADKSAWIRQAAQYRLDELPR
ncbi:MAG: hypothetical protein EPN53_12825 [Acidobacteria bacterium]|nr:MAG: hypothetical protein EPN53_12825 [Acidobacteriota bacterium]